MRINQNIAAFNSYRNLSQTSNVMGKSLEKLSSGFRINRAADDAAGLVISEGLRSQIGGLKQATRNAQDGVSVVQTAEGALQEVHSMLQRIRDLAVQSANGSYDADARAAADAEVTELKAEINRIGAETAFGDVKLLNGSFGKEPGTLTGFTANATTTFAGDEAFTVAVAGGSGAIAVSLEGVTKGGDELASYLTSKVRAALQSGNAADQAAASKVTVVAEQAGTGWNYTVQNSGDAAVTLADGANTPLAGDLGITPGAVAAATGTGGTFQVGANKDETISVSIANMDFSSITGGGTVDLTTQTGAEDAIAVLDTAIGAVSTQRGSLGAVQNRFEHTIANLQVTQENLSASESRIRDTDMALEMTQFTRHQILQQAGTAMLAQANQLPQSVLSLLR